MTVAALTLEQARVALAACDPDELELLRTLDAHECALVLEAKFYADARLLDEGGPLLRIAGHDAPPGVSPNRERVENSQPKEPT